MFALFLLGLSVLPSSVDLRGPEARHQFIAQATVDDHQEDWTRTAQWTSSNPAVARVDQTGLVTPVADGEVTITATAQGGGSASAKVRVKGTQAPFTWNFRNHVIPVMTKMGCNSGACHGAAAGKNGFKLTLRGYDPETDYVTLTRQAAGRCTNPLEPARSLILLKPTRTIPHMGGRRFEVGSPEYRVIAAWIASGMPPPTDADARIRSVEGTPARRVLAEGDALQLTVKARFSDGTVEDVTRWARYTSGDETVAEVGDTGLVKMQGYGETAINVSYLSQVAPARVAVPFPLA